MTRDLDPGSLSDFAFFNDALVASCSFAFRPVVGADFCFRL